MKPFILPGLVSALVLAAVGLYAGTAAFVTAILLTLLEITLSFDNAVVNARVLMGMSERWQKRFLTWGMLIAVFGTRLVLPILIVSASVWMSPIAVTHLAAVAPEEYGHLLEGARYAIHGFGAVFLLMVSLKYFFDTKKTVHWIKVVERYLARWGRIEAIEIGLGLIAVLAFSALVPEEGRFALLAAGTIGIVTFIAIQGLTSLFSVEAAEQAGAAAARGGLVLFLYLNILDSAFSLDSVVGAFALTTSILVIAAGLGIGAYFVRSLTIVLVRRRTLDTLPYLEHGAHWAILGLSGSMFAGLIFAVPEAVTGGVGAAFVIAAYWSSLRLRAREKAA